MASGQYGAGLDNGNEIVAAEGRAAGVPSKTVDHDTGYNTPLGPTALRYDYPGAVLHHDKGRESDEVQILGAQNPKLGSPQPPVSSFGERGDIPFDIKSPAVAPDTAAPNIYGS